MSLASALNTAQTIFSNTATQMQVVSKNIANASNDSYNRRAAILETADYGAKISEISRAENLVLSTANVDAISSLSAQQTLYDGLVQIKSVMGGNDYETSPATYIASLRDSLQAYSALPSDSTLAQTVISDAIDVANSLNATSEAIQTQRTEIDKEISLQITELDSLLADFKTVNDAVKGGTASGEDVNDELDRRDDLLKSISEIVGVQTMTRGDNDLVLYTTDGSVLFETLPRDITFTSLSGYDATTYGNSVYIDGVEVSAGSGGSTTASGSLQALLQLRDDVLPTLQSQMDELASALVTMFDEGTGNGLFGWSLPTGTSPPTVTPGTIYPGLASTIFVDDAYNTAVGGEATRLRDGYYVVSNAAGDTGYTDLLDGYVDAMGNDWTWDADTELNVSLSIIDFSSASIGWLEEIRSEASDAVDTKEATQARTSEALSNGTGVSLDEELSLLLDLEQSYKAASQLVSTVDEMMAALLAAAG